MCSATRHRVSLAGSLAWRKRGGEDVTSTDDIRKLRTSLKGTERDLGAPLGPEQAAGFGGRLQPYQWGTIYWHQDIGTHEVVHEILPRYIALGGPGVNPASNNRELGFPTTGWIRSVDERYWLTKFEYGEIRAVGERAVATYGATYATWQGRNGEGGLLGHPLSEVIQVAGGKATFFERGCVWSGPATNDVLIFATLTLPMIGQPAILDASHPEAVSFPAAIVWTMAAGIREVVAKTRPQLFEEIWAGRLQLTPVVARHEVRDAVVLVPQRGALDRELAPVVTELRLGMGAALTDRTLFDISMTFDDGKPHVLSAHSAYAKRDWSAFGVMHASDTHVSRRLDSFRKMLRFAGYHEGAERLINYNDNFRALIRHANGLHDKGELDAVLVTGDLIDYIWEADDSKTGGGNFRLLVDLIRGQAGLRDKVPSEELRVPIFLVLGNHDYRRNPYMLSFIVKYAGITHEVKNYPSLDLTRDEALAFDPDTALRSIVANTVQAPFRPWDVLRHKLDLRKPQPPVIGPEASFAQVEVDREVAYYLRHVNPERSYIVPLGPHRIVMIDSAWDVGVPDGTWDAFTVASGFDDNPDKRTFVGGAPNSRGFIDEHIRLLDDARTAAGPRGLVIVAMHAPPLNPKGNEGAHYLRETEHPTVERHQVDGHVARRNPVPIAQVATQFPDWIRTGTPNFKRGHIIGDFLDEGISKGRTEDFLKRCVGGDGKRKVDLVLCGHTHRDVEFRLQAAPQGGGFLVFTDFYTENPSNYYSAREVGPLPAQVGPLPAFGPATAGPSITDGIRERIFVSRWAEGQRVRTRVSANMANAGPNKVTDEREWAPWKHYWQRKIPEYRQPLGASVTPGAWWEQHRPLVIQTAAIGPTESNDRRDKDLNSHKPDPSFSGVRMIRVRDNVIQRISRISRADLVG